MTFYVILYGFMRLKLVCIATKRLLKHCRHGSAAAHGPHAAGGSIELLALSGVFLHVDRCLFELIKESSSMYIVYDSI